MLLAGEAGSSAGNRWKSYLREKEKRKEREGTREVYPEEEERLREREEKPATQRRR